MSVDDLLDQWDARPRLLSPAEVAQLDQTRRRIDEALARNSALSNPYLAGGPQPPKRPDWLTSVGLGAPA